MASSIKQTINKICQPTEKDIPDPISRELQYEKNVIFCKIISIILILTLANSISAGPWYLILGRLMPPSTLSFIFVLTCRRYPTIYGVSLVLIQFISVILSVKSEVESVLGVLVFMPLHILMALYFTNSIKITIGTVFSNFFLGYYFVFPQATIFIERNSPQEIASQICQASFFTTLFCFLLVYGVIHNLNLFHRIARRADSDKRKELLLSFSHELRNLIHNILGNLQLLHQESNLKEHARELVTTASACGEILQHLISNILDTGKTEIGNLEINSQPIHMGSTLYDIWNILSVLFKRKGLIGQLAVPSNFPSSIELDINRVIQILINLVSNAVKYTTEGNIDVKIEWLEHENHVKEECFEPKPYSVNMEAVFEKEQQTLRFRDDILLVSNHKQAQNLPLRLSQNYRDSFGVLKVTVSDTGCGISPENIDKIFNKQNAFYHDKTRLLGTKLGLSISKIICSKMRGEIRVFSKQNLGSSFIFCIPVKSLPESKVPNHDLPIRSPVVSRNVFTYSEQDMMNSSQQQKKKTAMIVDDDALCLTIISQYLQKLNIEVVQRCSNGKESVKMFKDMVLHNRKPDYVFMDIHMPVMDGKEASRQIRQYESEQNLQLCDNGQGAREAAASIDTELIIVSGNCLQTEISECTDVRGQIRAKFFLKKPLAFSTLKKIIDNQ